MTYTDRFPEESHSMMVNYASLDQTCTNSAITRPMQYLAFILFIQTVIIIIIEKMLTKVPRVDRMIEIFYRTIVEKSFLGNDPNELEDVIEDKIRTGACENLKRSSIIWKMYILKKSIGVFLTVLFIAFNVFLAMD